jgi:hypothetical protein
MMVLSIRIGHARPPAAAQFVERHVALAENGISLRLARWRRIYVLQRRVRKQNEVAPDAFVRYCELID